jgi:hypothetical protein
MPRPGGSVTMRLCRYPKQGRGRQNQAPTNDQRAKGQRSAQTSDDSVTLKVSHTGGQGPPYAYEYIPTYADWIGPGNL